MNFNVQCILMCWSYEFLLTSYVVQPTSTKENKHCSLDHEVHFENMYTRLSVDGRRQKPQEMSLLSYLVNMKGPMKSPEYNPSMGYEPYWPQGDWVFSKAPNKTTKGVSNEYCGIKCPEMFVKYGEICGRDRQHRYKTFKNYCVMISDDCTQRTDWLIAYKGECLEEIKTYPTKRLSIPSRASTYVAQFMAIQSTTQNVLDESFLSNFLITTKKK